MNSKKNNIMSNRMNYTENTEDEIDSLDEEEENKLYMNKKEVDYATSKYDIYNFVSIL